jgi:hypothetical protein
MHSRARISMVLGTLLVVGCSGDDGTGPGDDTLTDGEVLALFDALGESVAGLEDAAFEVSGSGQFDAEYPCPRGGDIDGSGTASESAGNRLTFDFTINYHDCKQDSESGIFTLDGSLREQGFFQFDETFETLSFEFALTGDVDWWLGDRSGSCEIDVEMMFEDEDTFALSGTICGEPVDSLE